MSTVAGWYPDSTGGHEFRYWDGGAWTSHVSDGGVVTDAPLMAAPAATVGVPLGVQQVGVPSTTADQLKTRLIFVLVGAGAILIGALLPWANQNNGFTTVSIDGTETGGGGISIVVALVVAAIAGLTMSRGFGRGSMIATLVLGCLEVVLVVANLADLGQIADEEAELGLPPGVGTTAGMGIIIALLGGAIVVIASILAIRTAQRS
jgi:hypothetical protein